MSKHSENCGSSAEIDDACEEMGFEIAAQLKRGEPLSADQLDWAQRHAGLSQRPSDAELRKLFATRYSEALSKGVSK